MHSELSLVLSLSRLFIAPVACAHVSMGSVCVGVKEGKGRVKKSSLSWGDIVILFFVFNLFMLPILSMSYCLFPISNQVSLMVELESLLIWPPSSSVFE